MIFQFIFLFIFYFFYLLFFYFLCLWQEQTCYLFQKSGGSPITLSLNESKVKGSGLLGTPLAGGACDKYTIPAQPNDSWLENSGYDLLISQNNYSKPDKRNGSQHARWGFKRKSVEHQNLWTLQANITIHILSKYHVDVWVSFPQFNVQSKPKPITGESSKHGLIQFKKILNIYFYCSIWI